MKSEKENYINSININSDTNFPYLVLDVENGRSYPRNPGFQVMHWHEDLQFIYVLSGSVTVKTLTDTVAVRQGEGIFINKNVVHFVGSGGECHYNSFIFPAQLLEFSLYSPAKQFVDCIVENEQFQLFHFTQREQWQDNVLQYLYRLSMLYKNKTEFYVYEVQVLLVTLWLTMRKNLGLPAKCKESVASICMQKFLYYIAQHYAEELTLENIAASANVSKSACAKYFHLNLQTTPDRKSVV